MDKLKSNLQNMVLVLTGSALICSGLLAYMNNITKPTIDIQKQIALDEGISKVLGGDAGKRLASPDTIKRNIAGKEQTFVLHKMQNGTAVESTDPNGFGGNLKVLVGFDDKGVILGYTLLEHAETPGLGAKADKWFQEGNPGNIIGKNPKIDNMTVNKDNGDINAITASTITSRAFLSAVQQAYNTFSQQTDATTGATTHTYNSTDANTGATKQANNANDNK